MNTDNRSTVSEDDARGFFFAKACVFLCGEGNGREDVCAHDRSAPQREVGRRRHAKCVFVSRSFQGPSEPWMFVPLDASWVASHPLDKIWRGFTAFCTEAQELESCGGAQSADETDFSDDMVHQASESLVNA